MFYVSSPDSIPPHFVTVFKSAAPSARLFKSELSHTCTLAVDFGDLITKIYQSCQDDVTWLGSCVLAVGLGAHSLYYLGLNVGEYGFCYVL